MNEGAIAEDLVGLGLTQYEAKVYVALVRRDSSMAAVASFAGDKRWKATTVSAQVLVH
jgi:sugar-specific transcriptional regulator TrmB